MKPQPKPPAAVLAEAKRMAERGLGWEDLKVKLGIPEGLARMIVAACGGK